MARKLMSIEGYHVLCDGAGAAVLPSADTDTDTEGSEERENGCC